MLLKFWSHFSAARHPREGGLLEGVWIVNFGKAKRSFDLVYKGLTGFLIMIFHLIAGLFNYSYLFFGGMKCRSPFPLLRETHNVRNEFE